MATIALLSHMREEAGDLTPKLEKYLKDNNERVRRAVAVALAFQNTNADVSDLLLDAIEKHHTAYGTSERVILDFRGPHNRALVLLPALH